MTTAQHLAAQGSHQEFRQELATVGQFETHYPNGQDSLDPSETLVFQDGSVLFVGNPQERVFEFFCYETYLNS